jgi:hypothetical protein
LTDTRSIPPSNIANSVASMRTELASAATWGTRNRPRSSRPICGSDQPNRGGPGCASLYADVSSAKALTIVGLTAGGLLAAGSVRSSFSRCRPTPASRPLRRGRSAVRSVRRPGYLATSRFEPAGCHRS